MSGNLLSRPRREGPADGTQISEEGLEYKQAIEHDVAAKINSTLEPLLGPDKFRTGVSADIDMTSGEQSEETFDPSKSVMVSSQKTEDTSGTTRIGPGIPGTAANLPPQQTVASNTPQQPPAATPPAQPGADQAKQPAAAPARTGGNTTSTTRRSESITYQTSRITKHLKLPQGTVKRLSIAVLVDQGSRMEGQRGAGPSRGYSSGPREVEGHSNAGGNLGWAWTPRVAISSPWRRCRLTTAWILSPDRWEAPGAQKKPDQVFSIETLKKKPALLWGSVGGVVLLIGLVAFGLARMMRGGKRRRERGDPRGFAGSGYVRRLASRTSGAAAPIGEPSRLPALMPSRTEVLLTQLQENSRNNPEAWANILRSWLAEEEAS